MGYWNVVAIANLKRSPLPQGLRQARASTNRQSRIALRDRRSWLCIVAKYFQRRGNPLDMRAKKGGRLRLQCGVPTGRTRCNGSPKMNPPHPVCVSGCGAGAPRATSQVLCHVDPGCKKKRGGSVLLHVPWLGPERRGGSSVPVSRAVT
jgi:hypothetical protein